MAEDFELSIKIASDVSDAIDSFKSLNTAANSAIRGLSAAFNELGLRLKTIGTEIERTGKQLSKFGKDLVRNITLPLTALAGISLKKIFDEAISGRGTEEMNRFAGAIQNLKKNFDEFTKDLGNRLAPIITPIINIINDLIEKWNDLDDSTKDIIVTIGVVAAAIGPIIVGFGAFLTIVGKLALAGGALSTGFATFMKFIAPLTGILTAANIAIVALIGSIAGITNLFLKLKESGLDTFDALLGAVNYFAAQFGSIVGGNVLKVISKLLQGIGYLASFASESLGNTIKSAGESVNQLAKDADKYAQETSKALDAQLGKIGTSAAEAFTFGLFGGIKKETDKEPVKFKLSPDVQQMLIDTRFAIAEAKRIVDEGNIERIKAEQDHQAKIKEITSGQETTDALTIKYQNQLDYLNKKFELDFQEIESERNKAIEIANINEDKTQKAIAISKAENDYKVAIAQATVDKEKQIRDAAFANESAQLQKRKELLDQYAKPFAEGLTGGLLDFAEGVKTAEEAFNDFARNFLRRIADMILQQAILNAISGFFTPSSSGSGGRSLGQTPQAFAEGGFVSGPGTGTSDSIPARLSNGEFVMTAASVKKYGSNFFDNLNALSRGHSKVSGLPGRFAEGGMVSGGGAPQVVIQNSGTAKDSAGTSFDPSTQVTTIILEDIQRNGSISKTIQGTFGVKRGGFR